MMIITIIISSSVKPAFRPALSRLVLNRLTIYQSLSFVPSSPIPCDLV
jgi:hypothetical protein